jgi:polar amino acid transport system substrate-binding protein
MTMKTLISMLTAALAFVAAPPAAEADGLDDIIQAGVVKIAVPADFPPFGSVGQDKQLEGYDIDVARLLAKDLGVKLELVPVSSANRVAYLQVGKVDLVISSLGVNPERARAIGFSRAYAPFYSGVFGGPKVAVKSPADLGGKTIAVTKGTLEDQELAKIAPPTATIRQLDDNKATIAALLSGQVDLIATGNVVAAAVARENPGKVERKFVIRNSPAHIGVRRDDLELTAWVNAFIYYKKLTGELDALARKWFGEPLPEFPTF